MKGCYEINKRERLKFGPNKVDLQYKVWYRTLLSKKRVYKWINAVSCSNYQLKLIKSDHCITRMNDIAMNKLRKILKDGRKDHIRKRTDDRFNDSMVSCCKD